VKTNSNIEVWLLETKYEGQADDSFDEIFIHIPRTNIWITDTAYTGERLENVDFTRLFWDRMYDEHLFTRLGEL